MKKVVVGIVSAAALATVGMAAASNSMVAPSANTNAAGVFVSGDLGYGYVDANNKYYQPTSSAKMDKSGFAWNGSVGYQFNRYLAIEAGYTHFGQVKATAANGQGSVTSALAGFNANVKGILPVSSKFSVFAKAGAIDMHETITSKPSAAILSKLNGSAWTPDLGLGVSYSVSKHVALTAQDIYAFKTTYSKNFIGSNDTVHVPAANAVLAGVTFKF